MGLQKFAFGRLAVYTKCNVTLQYPDRILSNQPTYSLNDFLSACKNRSIVIAVLPVAQRTAMVELNIRPNDARSVLASCLSANCFQYSTPMKKPLLRQDQPYPDIDVYKFNYRPFGRVYCAFFRHNVTRVWVIKSLKKDDLQQIGNQSWHDQLLSVKKGDKND